LDYYDQKKADAATDGNYGCAQCIRAGGIFVTKTTNWYGAVEMGDKYEGNCCPGATGHNRYLECGLKLATDTQADGRTPALVATEEDDGEGGTVHVHTLATGYSSSEDWDRTFDLAIGACP